MIARVNAKVNDSAFGRFFQMKERRTCLTTELRAGLVTFLTMAYILIVNASIISDSGGTCTIDDCTNPNPGCPFDPTDQGYTDCLFNFKKSMITSTAVIIIISTFVMGATANLPIVVAPGLGLNAYFTYNVVGFHGSGSVSYKTAVTCIFIEGWIFIILAITGVRGKLIQLAPKSLMLSTSAGIGLFLAFIGLQTSNGLGVVTFETATLVTLGGCPVSDRAPMYTLTADAASQVCNATAAAAAGATIPNLGNASSNTQCLRNRMESATVWLGISGFLVIVMCMRQRVRGAFLVGILWATFISWIPGHAASYFGEDSPIPGGQDRLDFFKEVVTKPDASASTAKFDFGGMRDGQAWLALITFLYVDFLDATGTLFSMASFIDLFHPGFVKEDKSWDRNIYAFISDGFAIVISGIFGSSPATAYIESASGIREGGRTGVTGLTLCALFFITLFFNPIFASIPPYAVGPALIIVGSMMVGNIVKIRWDLVSEGVPAFLTVAVMPLTYSIAYGFIAGAVSYVLINSAGFALDWLCAHGAPWLGPSEIMLDKEEKASIKNDFAHDASVGGHRAQEKMQEIAKDEESISTSSADDTAHGGAHHEKV